MDNISIAKVCGLCAGCKLAINKAIEAKQNHKNVTIFKALTHNPTVTKKIKDMGIEIAYDLTSLTPETIVILRAHGEPPETYKFLNENKIPFIDCTCKNVKDIHEKVKQKFAQGHQILIIGKYGKNGSEMHPEVAGTIGWCNNEAILVEDEDDLNKLNDCRGKKIYLICQTTFNEKKAENLIDKIKEICKNQNIELLIENTICMAQKIINNSSSELAKNCDLMFVVGGKNSSNTKELFENIKKITTTIFLDDITHWQDEVKKINFPLNSSTKIGITAGASTLKEELNELKTLIEETLKIQHLT